MLLSIVFVLIAVSFSCKWIKDTLLFHYEGSYWSKLPYQEYFNPGISWKNKYKYDLLPRLSLKKWLYKNPLVFLTDFWHLVQFFEINSTILVMAIALYMMYPAINIAFSFLVIRLLYWIIGLIWYKNRK